MYPILYLGVHGAPGAIQIGSDKIPLRDLYEFAGKGRGRVVHFGSCETLQTSKKELCSFVNRTRLAAICGFEKEVDWLHSCALEILILDLLSKRQISPRGMQAFQKQLKSMAGSLVKSLGFHMWDRGRLKT
jgi:hypothetical protein